MNTIIHNFTAKLTHPELAAAVARSIRPCRPTPTASLRGALFDSRSGVAGPISINLDLTVACNYACTHCIDAAILNTGHRYGFQTIARSLVVLRLAGLRSIILIGGGEPTLHPHFNAIVGVIKLLGLQCAVVSNGSRNERLIEAAPVLTRGDWIRLSLDAASDSTFQRMHRPTTMKAPSLERICATVGTIKKANPDVSIGYSFIVSWSGATVSGKSIIDNIDEMADAACLAKASGFDYISYKPLLDRDDFGSETIDGPDLTSVKERITKQLEKAKRFVSPRFRVAESTNLIALTDPVLARPYKTQPVRCRMHYFRQVLTPGGTFGCPVYRGAEKDRIGTSDIYSDALQFIEARRRTATLVDGFDASQQCAHVTCLYNATNWWLERQATQNDVNISADNATTDADFFL